MQWLNLIVQTLVMSTGIPDTFIYGILAFMLSLGLYKFVKDWLPF